MSSESTFSPGSRVEWNDSEGLHTGSVVGLDLDYDEYIIEPDKILSTQAGISGGKNVRLRRDRVRLNTAGD